MQSLKQLSGLLEAQDMDERAGLIWLLECSANVSDADLDSYMSYGHGIGPEKVCYELSTPCLRFSCRRLVTAHEAHPRLCY